MVIFTKKFGTLDPHLPIVWDKVPKKTFFWHLPLSTVNILVFRVTIWNAMNLKNHRDNCRRITVQCETWLTTTESYSANFELELRTVPGHHFLITSTTQIVVTSLFHRTSPGSTGKQDCCASSSSPLPSWGYSASLPAPLPSLGSSCASPPCAVCRRPSQGTAPWDHLFAQLHLARVMKSVKRKEEKERVSKWSSQCYCFYDIWWYWVNRRRYWLVLGGTGSVWSGTGLYLVVLGQYMAVLVDL